MKPQTFAVPNSLHCAINAIDEMVARGLLTPPTGTLVKLLYMRGWDDGFASIPRTDADRLFGLGAVDIARSLRQLASLGFRSLARSRGKAQHRDHCRSGGAMTGGLPLSWWLYYQVDVQQPNEIRRRGKSPPWRLLGRSP
jgi:hypothetical protein